MYKYCTNTPDGVGCPPCRVVGRPPICLYKSAIQITVVIYTNSSIQIYIYIYTNNLYIQIIVWQRGRSGVKGKYFTPRADGVGFGRVARPVGRVARRPVRAHVCMISGAGFPNPCEQMFVSYRLSTYPTTTVPLQPIGGILSETKSIF